jgi:hypothetical protein
VDSIRLGPKCRWKLPNGNFGGLGLQPLFLLFALTRERGAHWGVRRLDARNARRFLEVLTVHGDRPEWAPAKLSVGSKAGAISEIHTKKECDFPR